MKFAAFMFKAAAGLIFLLLSVAVRAGDQPPAVDVSKIVLADTLHSRCWFFADSSRAVSVAQIVSLPFTRQAPLNIFKTANARQVDKDWYLKFCLENSADTAIAVFFYPGIYFS